MKIAIHQNKTMFNHSTSWDIEWIKYCQINNIDFEIVNCFESNIIDKLREFDCVVWHFQNYVLQDMLFARSILQSAKEMGLKVFPDFNTAWHFDDKIAQMFLLQSINAPIPKHWFFATLDSCNNWIKKEANFPLIAKLKCGSGSHNVKMLKSKSEAIRYTSRIFGKGFSSSPNILFKASSNLKSSKNLTTILKRIKKIPDFIQTYTRASSFGKERDYCSFQEFIPNDGYDLKIYVIGDKVSYLGRKTRKGDFRASGGGTLLYDKSLVTNNILKSAFETYDKLKFQCMGFDYVVDKNTNEGKIIEMSFGFAHQALLDTGGYWDRNLKWHNEPINAPFEVLKNLTKTK